MRSLSIHPGYDVANLIILDGEIDRDYASNQALTGGGGDIFRLDLATIGDGKASGALTLNLRDFSGDNILHLIADGDAPTSSPALITTRSPD